MTRIIFTKINLREVKEMFQDVVFICFPDRLLVALLRRYRSPWGLSGRAAWTSWQSSKMSSCFPYFLMVDVGLGRILVWIYYFRIYTRISKLGLLKTKKLVWENPTLIGKYKMSNYEKTQNWEFLKWENCHKTYTSNLSESQNWEIEIQRIPIFEN